jgi:cyclophilin family peptidyl-prolyl cis-trans isomerase
MIATALCVWFGIRRSGAAPPPTPPVQVDCQTTKGQLEIQVMTQWSPIGAKRFLELVDDGYFNHLPLFRCMQNFICQFGPALPSAHVKTYSPIADDPPRSDLRSFREGYVSFAGYAPNTREADLFIALAAAPSLGTQPWETPIGYVTDASMSTVRQFNTSYGDTYPTGHGPERQKITAADGDEYLKNNFPNLDYFLSCSRKH